jgi:hypothetical protein
MKVRPTIPIGSAVLPVDFLKTMENGIAAYRKQD